MGQGRADLRNQAWRRKRKVVLERDSYECQIRGRGCTMEATEVDHIVPHALGGDADLNNLRAACKPCNSSLGTAARRGGAILTRAPHPSPPRHGSLPRDPVAAPTLGVWHLDVTG
jgi:5-methylcytosine-specific restriction endonuclease McrA